MVQSSNSGQLDHLSGSIRPGLNRSGDWRVLSKRVMSSIGDDITRNKKTISVSRGFLSALSRDQDNPCELSRSVFQQKEFAKDFEVQ